MVCQRCGKNHANVKIVKNYNGAVKELYVCSSCANDEDFNLNLNFTNNSIFDSLLQMFTPMSQSELFCEGCKMSYRDFKNKGKFGCAKCYETFESFLDPLFKTIHGHVQHVGKLPKKSAAPIRKKRNLETLRTHLKAAIEKEYFEEAARLRDEIKKAEGGTPS